MGVPRVWALNDSNNAEGKGGGDVKNLGKPADVILEPYLLLLAQYLSECLFIKLRG